MSIQIVREHFSDMADELLRFVSNTGQSVVIMTGDTPTFELRPYEPSDTPAPTHTIEDWRQAAAPPHIVERMAHGLRAGTVTLTQARATLEGVTLPLNEFARLAHIKTSTFRRNYCVNGHFHNIRPIKQANGRLLIDAIDAANYLAGVDCAPRR